MRGLRRRGRPQSPGGRPLRCTGVNRVFQGPIPREHRRRGGASPTLTSAASDTPWPRVPLKRGGGVQRGWSAPPPHSPPPSPVGCRVFRGAKQEFFGAIVRANMKKEDRQQTTIAVPNCKLGAPRLYRSSPKGKKAAAVAMACNGTPPPPPRRDVNVPQCHARCQGKGAGKGSLRLPSLHEHDGCQGCSIGARKATDNRR